MENRPTNLWNSREE